MTNIELFPGRHRSKFSPPKHIKQFHPTLIIHKSLAGYFQICIQNAAGQEAIGEWQPTLLAAIDEGEKWIANNLGPNRKLKFQLIKDHE